MTRGYWSLATIAARWNVSADKARAMLADCARIKLGRSVRYAIEDVLAIEHEATLNPGAVKRPARARRAPVRSLREIELRRHFGVA